MEKLMMASPLGNILLETDVKGITFVQFSKAENVAFKTKNPILNQCAQELKEYFADKRTFFTTPLSLKGTNFQIRVWKELQNIPFGTTSTYLEMAKKLGNPKVIRAAASANGKNPIVIIVPCHRVIGTNGDLVGYAAGLDKKKWLLEHEGILTKKQFDLFLPR